MYRRSHAEGSEGFALSLVVVLGFILAIGGMTLIARSFGGLVGSVRQQKSREAREAAEIGLAVTMEALNGGYGYLMINCYPNPGNPTADATKPLFGNSESPVKNSCYHTGGWGVDPDDSQGRDDIAPEFPSSLCPGSRTGYPRLDGSLTVPTMRYRVDFYAFNGTEFYGGKGTLKVTGESLSDDQTKVLATSTIQQTFNVITEPCGGFPGLLMINDGNIGNNDILGFNSKANVHCVECDIEGDPNQYGMYSEDQLRDAVGASLDENRAQIGNISIGPIEFPDVPRFPDKDVDCIKPGCTTLNEGYGDDPALQTANSHNFSRQDNNQNILKIVSLNVDGNPSEAWWQNNNHHEKFDFSPTFIDLSNNASPPVLPPLPGAADEAPGFYVTTDGWRIVAGNVEGALNVERATIDGISDQYVHKNTDNLISDFCVVLKDAGEMVTHCKLGNFKVGSNKLTVNTENGPVRLYFDGATIAVSGKGGVEHVRTSAQDKPPASRLGFFGVRDGGSVVDYQSDSKLTCDAGAEQNLQSVTLSGGGGYSDLFAYFPCGVVGINGGSSGEVADGYCKQPGDMNGAIWAAYWNGSNSDNAELCVPDDMINQLRYFFGADFALSVRRYRAQGISDWRGFQGLSQ